jgi:integrase
MVRTLFAWGYKTGRLDVPVRTGEDFRQPPKRSLRKARQERGERLVEAADARKLIDEADGQLRAMILLALNAGFGATDCSALNRSALARPGWLKDERPKTGTPRRAMLWPETIATLADVAKTRPEPADPVDQDAVFLTAKGNRWVRHRSKEEGMGVNFDAVAGEFTKLAKRCKVKASFYVMRHVFRTVTDELPDVPAIRLVMGHTDGSIDDHYRERISDERVAAVVRHVHAWLWEDTSHA